MAAGARAGGRGAGRRPRYPRLGTPAFWSSGPLEAVAAPQDAAAPPDSRLDPPGESVPHPHTAPPQLLRPPALRRESRRKGEETEAGTRAPAEGPGSALLPHPCAPGGGGAAADAGRSTPGCGQPATLRRFCPAGNTPGLRAEAEK